MIPSTGCAAVGHHHRQDSGNDKNNASRGITAKESMQMFHFLFLFQVNRSFLLFYPAQIIVKIRL
ncbi:Uncharacterised protein [Shigella sonnei]|nr:Uncharacterised protein [Shigella sonnei]